LQIQSLQALASSFQYVLSSNFILYTFTWLSDTYLTSTSQAARDVCASYDIIADVFEHIVYFFRRLELYPEVSPTNEMKDIIAKMLMEALSILAIATREIKQCRMSGSLYKLNTSQLAEPCKEKWLTKLIGKTYIEDSLRVLDKLTQEEARMSTSQVLKAIIKSMNEDINESVAGIVYGM
jgi:hypothetical protein